MNYKLWLCTLSLAFTSCQNSGKIISQSGKECPHLQNTHSSSIYSYSLAYYRGNGEVIETSIISLKPGEIVYLKDCKGVKSKIIGSTKISQINYLQHKCNDSYPYRKCRQPK